MQPSKLCKRRLAKEWKMLVTNAAENARCCNQATCAQKTDGVSGGSFSCAAGSIPKSNPETINCGATPCAANSDGAENEDKKETFEIGDRVQCRTRMYIIVFSNFVEIINTIFFT